MIVAFWLRNYLLSGTNLLLWLMTASYWILWIAYGSWIGIFFGWALLVMNVYAPFRFMWDDLMLWKNIVREVVAKADISEQHHNAVTNTCMKSIERLCPNLNTISLIVIEAIVDNAIKLRSKTK